MASHQQAREQAFSSGRKARKEGRTADENPHVCATEERTCLSDAKRDAWELGWQTEDRAQSRALNLVA